MKTVVLTLTFILFATSAMAWGSGNIAKHKLDVRGDRLAAYYDAKGNRINAKLDRMALKAALNGNYKRARALDIKGDKLNAYYDRKGQILNTRLNRKGRAIDRRMDRYTALK